MKFQDKDQRYTSFRKKKINITQHEDFGTFAKRYLVAQLLLKAIQKFHLNKTLYTENTPIIAQYL